MWVNGKVSWELYLKLEGELHLKCDGNTFLWVMGVGGAGATLEIKYYGKIKDDVLFYCNVCSNACVVVGLELLLCNDKIYLES